jgi:hypothetical protein
MPVARKARSGIIAASSLIYIGEIDKVGIESEADLRSKRSRSCAITIRELVQPLHPPSPLTVSEPENPV